MSPALLLLPLLLLQEVWSYDAPEAKPDDFALKACSALLTFRNVAYMSGATVELVCHCKPSEVRSVVWFHQKHLSSSEDTRVLTDHRGNTLLGSSQVPHSGDLQSRTSIRLFSLVIFRAGPDDSGIYICGSAQKDYFFSYDVDIQKASKISFFSSPKEESTVRPSREMRTSTQLYKVFTVFQPWTVCDRCGVPGEQFRVGLCYVESDYLHLRYRQINHTYTSCGSGAVPRAFSQFKQDNGGAKMEVRSCEASCPPQPTAPSKLQTVLLIIGYSSSSEPAGLPVYYLARPAEHTLSLGCPGAQPNLAVAWDRESHPIYRSEHLVSGGSRTTSSRVHIDTGHHLVFTPAKTEDSGVYYCWVNGHRAAEIRLLVYSHLGRRQSVTSHPDFPLALRTVLTSYVAMTALFFVVLLIRIGIRVFRDSVEEHLD